MYNYKALILPFVGVLAIVFKLFFDVDMPEELQNGLAEAISSLVAIVMVIIGILRNNTKKDVPKE